MNGCLGPDRVIHKCTGSSCLPLQLFFFNFSKYVQFNVTSSYQVDVEGVFDRFHRDNCL